MKFKTTFDTIWLRSIPSSNVLIFYYTSAVQGKQARKSGIPAWKQFNGIPLTLRPPHATTKSDFDVFATPKTVNQSIPSSSSSSSSAATHQFPNEEVLALSLPQQFLVPLSGYESDEEEEDGLYLLPAQVLSAFRPSNNFNGVVDKQPWLDRQTLLPPSCIIRSFLLEEQDETKKNISTSSSSFQQKDQPSTLNKDDNNNNTSNNTNNNNNIVSDVMVQSFNREVFLPLDSIANYLKEMTLIRLRAKEFKIIPLYHYTSPTVASLILKGGLRMSSQGQGDGGVYVSTQGPASYGLGTEQYEENIIKDCFGAERIDEYLGKGNLDVVIVYGCEGTVLEQTPGGRINAKMFSKSLFEQFSLASSDGSYYLRPDRILGCFYVDPHNLPQITTTSMKLLDNEMIHDRWSVEKIKDLNLLRLKNSLRIDKALSKLSENTQLSPHSIPAPSPSSPSPSSSSSSSSSSKTTTSPLFSSSSPSLPSLPPLSLYSSSSSSIVTAEEPILTTNQKLDLNHETPLKKELFLV
eukprot:CAMPEP_0114340390 /NCGR_PEP_ID=MMETSP0101-20121206/8348_1 /TAXON_ID=38822 ORGANISM="Pteridomonas danica, Strain PT" /NCGR_SAMPLE_ID=MMETSP0101 /ASSEMBLY_ACC=CAM_ASM_000211 /LENGTH=520 /DNA_ID=CAMNT_0001473643 /DNA_START=2727 /DNA_END=4289 /DNA_ORIENTATION=-